MKIATCVLVAASVVVATACTTIRQMPLPDGTMGYAFECNGVMETVDECYAHIATLCPQGSLIVAQSQSSVIGFDPLVRTLYVRCNKLSA